jgi:hypothetical protein
MIKFISHEFLTEDPYTKEIVYLSIDDKFRFAYVRKLMKNGGLFWAPISVSATYNGNKKYFESIQWDSNFLKQDIIAFLEGRSWENPQHKPQFIDVTPIPQQQQNQPQYQQASFLGDCPF